MLNFTGLTNKRVVNLGNGRGARSLNFLQQAQLERQKRERERTREKAATVLQSAIRRHLDLSKIAVAFYTAWTGTDNFRNQSQWNEWLVEFGFLASNSNINGTELVAKLESEIKANHNLEIDNRHLYVVLRGLSCVLQRDSKRDAVLRVILGLLHKCSPSPDAKFPQGIIKNVLSVALNSNRQTVLDIVFYINVRDDSGDFYDFLAGPQLHIEPNSNYRHIINTLDLSQDPECDPLRLANTMSNIIALFGNPDQWRTEDYSTVLPILAKMDFRLALTDDDDDDNRDMDLDDPEELNTTGDCIEVESEVMDNIQKLYSSNILQHIISQLRELNNSVYLHALVCLLRLIPMHKDRIAMHITLVPGFQKQLLSVIQASPIYATIVDDDQEIVTIDISQNASDFWNIVYLFHESYSYWLLVSNDFESFNEDKLTKDDIIPYLTFLKRLCLSLILNSCPKELVFMKNISITLLNQLYQKNSRLKFVPDHEKFWILKSNQVNVTAMVQLIEQEEQWQNSEDIDSAGPQFQKFRRSSELAKLRGSTPHTTARLELLRKLPFFVPFMDRVRIFKELSTREGERSFQSFFMAESKLSGDIRRESVLEDAFNSFHNAGTSMKAKLSVRFFNEFGIEAGIDGGGLTKEFLTAVVADGFSKPEYFKSTPEHTVYPDDDIYYKLSRKIDVDESYEQLKMIKFLGNIIGKCLYENVLVDITFAPFFLSKWGYATKNSINDLYYYDKEYFDNLIKLSKLSASELDDLDLYFNINVRVNERDFIYNLMPDGSNIKVNSLNVLNYIHQIANFKLNQSLYIQTKYFVEGLSELIEIDRLAMFSPSELQMLISGGDNPDVDIAEWKRNVSYGGYLEDDLTVRMFWDVIENDFTAKQRCELLKFVTSVSRAPLLGFGSLSPLFGIRNSGRDVDRLPTASTCVNLLKLPDYQDRETLKKKLLYVIESESGFDLS